MKKRIVRVDIRGMRKNLFTLCALSKYFYRRKYDPYSSYIDNDYRIAVMDLSTVLEYVNNSRKRAEFVAKKMAEMDYSVSKHPFTHYFWRAGKEECLNIQAVRRGRSKKEIWFTGHHDYRRGYGAEDNGTSLVVMLELARLFQKLNLEHTIRFVSFDLEEFGLKGSTAFLSNADSEGIRYLGRIRYLVNLDCLGSGRDISVCQFVGRERWMSNRSLNRRILKTAKNLGFNFHQEGFDWFRSDHVPFIIVGVPATEITSNNLKKARLYEGQSPRKGGVRDAQISVAHTIYDKPENINIAQLAKVVKTLYHLVLDLENKKNKNY